LQKRRRCLALIFIDEAVSFTFRKYGLPYGLSVSLCTLHLMVTHFDATLGRGSWGYTLPNRDFHPVRDIKLLGASFTESYQNY